MVAEHSQEDLLAAPVRFGLRLTAYDQKGQLQRLINEVLSAFPGSAPNFTAA